MTKMNRVTDASRKSFKPPGYEIVSSPCVTCWLSACVWSSKSAFSEPSYTGEAASVFSDDEASFPSLSDSYWSTPVALDRDIAENSVFSVLASRFRVAGYGFLRKV